MIELKIRGVKWVVELVKLRKLHSANILQEHHGKFSLTTIANYIALASIIREAWRLAQCLPCSHGESGSHCAKIYAKVRK